MAIEWEKTDNTRVDGSTDFTETVYLGVCKKACESDANCDAVDWESSTGRCWQHGPWTVNTVTVSAPGFTHYDLFRFCPSTCVTFFS